MTEIEINSSIDPETINNIVTDLRYGLRIPDIKEKYRCIIIIEDQLSFKQIKYLIQILETYLKKTDIESISINA